MTTNSASILSASAATFPDGVRILSAIAHLLGDMTAEWRRREMWKGLAAGPRARLSREDAEAGLLLLAAALDAGDEAASTDANEIRAYLAPLPSFGDSGGDQTRADIQKASMAHSDTDYLLSRRHYGRR